MVWLQALGLQTLPDISQHINMEISYHMNMDISHHINVEISYDINMEISYSPMIGEISCASRSKHCVRGGQVAK